MLLKLLFIGLGGFMGANLRFLAGVFFDTRYGHLGFPIGTLIVNIVGCFLLGFIATLLEERLIGFPNARFLVTIGFLGSFTTFSTFSFESWRLIEEGSMGLAALNLGASVVLGGVAVVVGAALARAL
ncbi:MAG: fluoride efflux transporter CrcB [Chloroflexota bacterium]|nr:fluoride efflux transporter CrcB [Chloroflexota bacterium]